MKRVCVTSGVLVVLGVLGGCSGASAPKATDKGISAGLNALSPAAGSGLTLGSTPDPEEPLTKQDKERMVARAALDLEDVLNGVPVPGTPPPAAPAPVRELDAGVLNAAAIAWEEAASKAQAGGVTKPVAASAISAEDPLLELASRMAGMLAGPEGTRIPDAVALAAIEGVKPGVLTDLEAPTNVLGSRLSAEDRAVLLAARERVLASPSAASEALVKALARMSPPAALRIARSALCRRVQGFGRFDAFESDSFVAGRPIRLIVYVEIDGFSARPARDGDPAQAGIALADQVSIELAQSLTLYHDPSGLQAWHRPAQRVVETSRAKRRDFYLVHQVELPGTLTVGRYRLKVTVTDKTTGASDEVTMPVNVVVR